MMPNKDWGIITERSAEKLAGAGGRDCLGFLAESLGVEELTHWERP